MTIQITNNIRVVDNSYGGFNVQKLIVTKNKETQEITERWAFIANYQTLDVLLSRIALKCPEVQDENLTDAKQVCKLLKEISDKAFKAFHDITFEDGQFIKLQRNVVEEVKSKKGVKVLTEEHKRKLQLGRQNSKLKRDNASKNK